MARGPGDLCSAGNDTVVDDRTRARRAARGWRMTSTERRRLVGILGRLGSDHDGERAAAGLLASRMLREAGLQWDDLIGEPETSRRRDVLPAGWRADLTLASRHASFCRPWEQNFLRSIANKPGLSTKQRSILAEIATALRERGLA